LGNNGSWLRLDLWRRWSGCDLDVSQALLASLIPTRPASAASAATCRARPACAFIVDLDLASNQQWRGQQQRDDQDVQDNRDDRTRRLPLFADWYSDGGTVRRPLGLPCVVWVVAESRLHHG